MIALQISSMKNFMSHLLVGDTFDPFLLEEATISMANTVTIDGRINKEFFSTDSGSESDTAALPEFRPWSEIKGLCFDLIKGKHTPLSFRFILHMIPEKAEALLKKEAPDSDISQVKALMINIKFDGTRILVTTGTSYHTFVLSKEADLVWDKALSKYLSMKGIEFEQL